VVAAELRLVAQGALAADDTAWASQAAQPTMGVAGEIGQNGKDDTDKGSTHTDHHANQS